VYSAVPQWSYLRLTSADAAIVIMYDYALIVPISFQLISYPEQILIFFVYLR
jgi:hypothetical protein